MQKPLFLTQPGPLQKGLFTTYTVRQGVQTTLNINYLPDLLQYVKRSLLPQELLRLEDYYLQNYLMELSIGYSGRPELNDLVESILNHIRSNNHFWYRHNNKQIIEEEQEMKHHAISSYQNDIEHLQQAFKGEDKMVEFVPTYPKKTSTHFCYRLMHINSEGYCGTKHSLNHLAYIPQFLAQTRAKVESPGETNEKNSKDEDNLKQQKQLVQQCILFMLKNKLNKVIKKQKMVSSNPSEQNEQSEDQSQSSSSGQQGEEEQQAEHQKTIIDEFIEYIENIPNIPKFQTSHHMYTLTHNILLTCQSIRTVREKVHQNMKSNERRRNFKKHELKDSIDYLEIPLSCQQLLTNLSEKELNQNQCQAIIQTFLVLWYKKLRLLEKDIEAQTATSKRGWLCTQNQIDTIKAGYEQMLVIPEFMELNKFRATGAGVPWKEEDYKNFLKGLSEFINIPTNNKRIASFMGDKVEPNHVKHVKGVYLTVMKDRMERGECGGGKRGKCLSKIEFIEKDIASFSMRWFEKSKKIKKKLKRKRRNSSEEGMEEDVDSQY